MKLLKTFLPFIAVLFLLTACEKETTPTLAQINYQLKDNITPTYATFKLNVHTKRSVWKLNDKEFFSSDSNSVEILLMNPGKNIVTVETRGINGEKYEGEIEVYAPPRPSILQINGFHFPEISDFNFETDSLLVEIYHNDNFENKSYHFYFKSNELLENDTIFFKRPILFGLSKNDFSYDDTSVIYFTLRDKTNYLPKWYFRTNFYVFSQLFTERLSFGDNIIRAFGTNDKQVHVFADWK